MLNLTSMFTPPSFVQQLEDYHRAAGNMATGENTMSDSARRHLTRGEKFCSRHQRMEPIDRFDTRPQAYKLYFLSSCREGMAEIKQANLNAAAEKRLAAQYKQLPEQFDRPTAMRIWGMDSTVGSGGRIKKMIAKGWLIAEKVGKGRFDTYRKVKK